jgi:hypothetical protein
MPLFLRPPRGRADLWRGCCMPVGTPDYHNLHLSLRDYSDYSSTLWFRMRKNIGSALAVTVQKFEFQRRLSGPRVAAKGIRRVPLRVEVPHRRSERNLHE